MSKKRRVLIRRADLTSITHPASIRDAGELP